MSILRNKVHKSHRGYKSRCGSDSYMNQIKISGLWKYVTCKKCLSLRKY
jgi:hypothetical protein